MALTQDQEKAAQAFFDFMMTDDKFFCISGSAGVGKTYMMHHISTQGMTEYETSCRLIGKEPEYDKIVFTATTNKAAEVLEKSINAPATTIHNFLHTKVVNDASSKQTFLRQIAKPNTHRAVIFIDEASMIDEDLYNILRQSIPTAKVVFVGDHAQMAPVNEEMSPIYKDIKADNFVFLNQLVRNADTPALVDLCAQLRHTVETGEFFVMNAVPGVIDYLDPDQMQQAINVTFSQVNPSSRILCYTNERVHTYNEYIRSMRGLPDTFVNGERVIAAKAYFDRNKGISVSVERELEIDRLFSTKSIGYEQFTANQQPLKAHVYSVSRIDSSGQPFEHPFELPVPADSEAYQYALKKTARTKNWHAYHALRDATGDIRNKDACTVYKSQGSTYDSVFVDLGNIGTSRDPAQVARMLFVAVSRAKHRVFFYGRLPARYYGKKSA